MYKVTLRVSYLRKALRPYAPIYRGLSVLSNYCKGDTMPRSKPTQVTEHRITLGTKERKMMEATQAAMMVKDIGTGIGIAAVGVGGSLIAFKIGKSIYDWAEGGLGDEILEAIGLDEKTADAIAESNVLSEKAKGNPNWLYRFTLRTLGL